VREVSDLIDPQERNAVKRVRQNCKRGEPFRERNRNSNY